MSTSRRPPCGMRETTVDTRSGPVECLRNEPADPGTPVAITVNGLAETRHRWGPALVQAARLGHTAYSYDHIGQFAARQATDRTVASLADELWALIDELSPAAPVHLVGGCLGGFVARDLTYRAPHRIRSLVLLGSGWDMAGSAAPQLHEQVAHAVATDGMNAVFDKIREEAVRAGISHRSVDRIRESYLAIRPEFLVGFSRSAADYPDTTERLPAQGNMTAPVLVTHGSADDMWDAAQQRHLAERMNAPVTVIEGAGHSPTVTHPRATAEALARFWSAVDSCIPLTPQPELDTAPA